METDNELDVTTKSCYCGSEIEIGLEVTTDCGDVICQECSVTCERCDTIGSIRDDFHSVDDHQTWCNACTDNHAHWCEWHDGYFTGYTYSAEDSSYTFCEMCYNDNTHYCETCETAYVEGCDNNHDDEVDSRIIHDYSYKPDPIFHSSPDENTRLYFGIEVETESSGSENYSNRREAAEFAYRLEQSNLAYIKSDGSLDCGFEVVTHPMTHSFYMNDATLLWDTISRLKAEHNMMAWGTNTCGLHIHISRNGFSTGSHQHRFLQLVYNNKELYELLAGRSATHWAKFDDVVNQSTGKKSFRYKLDTHHRDTDRYSAVNTINRNTLEMRIFRGSLNIGFIKASIDLAHASVEFTRVMSVKQVIDGGLSTAKFVEYIREKGILYPALNARLDKFSQTIKGMERNTNVFIGSKFTEQHSE